MAFTPDIFQRILRAAVIDNANGEIYWISYINPHSFNTIIKTIKLVLLNEFRIVKKDKNIRLPNFISDVAYIADSVIQKQVYTIRKCMSFQR